MISLVASDMSQGVVSALWFNGRHTFQVLPVPNFNWDRHLRVLTP